VRAPTGICRYCILNAQAERHEEMAQYWVRNGKSIYGPFTGSQLKRLAKKGELKSHHLISADQKEWTVAESVTGLEFQADSTPKPTDAPNVTDMAEQMAQQLRDNAKTRRDASIRASALVVFGGIMTIAGAYATGLNNMRAHPFITLLITAVFAGILVSVHFLASKLGKQEQRETSDDPVTFRSQRIRTQLELTIVSCLLIVAAFIGALMPPDIMTPGFQSQIIDRLLHVVLLVYLVLFAVGVCGLFVREQDLTRPDSFPPSVPTLTMPLGQPCELCVGRPQRMADGHVCVEMSASQLRGKWTRTATLSVPVPVCSQCGRLLNRLRTWTSIVTIWPFVVFPLLASPDFRSPGVSFLLYLALQIGFGGLPDVMVRWFGVAFPGQLQLHPNVDLALRNGWQIDYRSSLLFRLFAFWRRGNP
jgi:hypothetical protein